MAINLGTGAIDKLYLGATEITKAYLGATEIYSAGGVTNNAFELTVETTAANENFLLPMQSVTSIDIDWGDGTVDTGITTNNPTHVYATAGTHAISVTGTAGTVVFSGSGSEGKVRTVTNLGALGWTTMFRAFRSCSNMTSFDAGDCDTSSVTSMQDMLIFCSSLTTVDLSGLDTSSVTTMRFMLYNCTSLTTLDVSGFDTSIVTDMSSVFENCSLLTTLDVSSFNTSSVTSMNRMFRLCSSLTDIVGVEDFNIEGLDSTKDLDNFATNVTLPTSRYDALLINWDAQEPLDNLSPDFGNSKYTAGGAAEAARTSLINGDGWTITDGGSV